MAGRILFASCSVAVAVSAAFVHPSAAIGQDSMESIIKAVHANEELYRDIEVKAASEYRLVQPEAYYPGVALGSHRTELRSIFQGDDFYYHEAGAAKTIDRSVEQKIDLTAAYDGEWTRINDNNNYANLIKSRHEAAYLIRPHSLPFRKILGAPLSTYLRGGDELARHPAAGPYKDQSTLTVRFESGATRSVENRCAGPGRA
jgi:hypothetical protein